MQHQSVLLSESLLGLSIDPDGIYIDATFGRGGHSNAILEKLSPKGRLIALDRDPEAVCHAREYFANDKRFEIHEIPFSKLEELVESLGLLGRVNGILLDLGVSSPQLDTASRGFSFMKEGPLNMRMGEDVEKDARFFVNHASHHEMVKIFREYGEERYSMRIARAIESARAVKPIETTLELVEIIRQAVPRTEKHKHPATRVFQALRIHVNRELEELKAVLNASMKVLSKGGRLVCISFHSLEDRIVKHFMKEKSEGPAIPRGLPIRETKREFSLKRIGKAVKPQQEEMEKNIRSRSAVLRIGEKLA